MEKANATTNNPFLCSAIRENGIPFPLKRNVPNEITAAAIEEGRRIAEDSSVPGYASISALREALGV